MSDNHYAPARVADNAGRAQIITPRFGQDPTVVPGVSNAWSAWGALIDPTSGDWVALGAYAQILGLASANTVVHVQMQLATGAAGAEVPFATIGDAFAELNSTGTYVYIIYYRTFLFPPILIPSGSRISQRASVNTAGAYARIRPSIFGVPAGFYQRMHPLHRPDMYMRGRTGMAASLAMANWMILPSPTSQTTVTTGAGAFGAWAQVISPASQTQPLILTGLKVAEAAAGSLLNYPVLAEIGIGATGAEIGVEEVKFPDNNPGSPDGYLQLRRPIYIPAGTGINIRAGSDGGSYGMLFQVTAVPLR
jgi:hypothetical protein